MAKQAVAVPSKGRSAPAGKGVATRANSDPAAIAKINEMMKADAGKGVSTAMEDNVVPLIYILQALSPQVQKKKPESYIKDAEAGMIWFRGTKDLVNGDDGMAVVPCHFNKVWIEWQPNRGGFVARHDEKPANAVMKEDIENKKKFWGLPNGNIVVETREHVVIVLDVFDTPTPFVIPMSGSGHKASRDWMTLQNQKRNPDDPTLKAPSYGFIYRMKTLFRTNDQGDWFTWIIENENGETTQLADPEVYLMARQIEIDFSGGKKVAAHGDMDGADTDVSGTDSAAGKHI
jgi:hypothetical protein